MNYKEVDLSIDEKLKYIVKGIVISFLISYLFYGNLWVGIIISIGYTITMKEYKERILNKRNQEMLIQFRDMLYSISSSISTGRNMTQALRESVSFWESTYEKNDFIMVELNYMVRQIENSNIDDIDVLMDFAKRTGLEDINNFVLTYINAKTTGCNLSLAINNAAEIISEKINIEKELNSSLKEKEFESKIVTYSPFVILTFLRLTSKDYLGVFLTTPKGHLIATISLLLIYISSIISKRLVKIEI